MSDIGAWLQERGITAVECLVADQNGIARGKILQAAKFIRSHQDGNLRIPEELFVRTVTGNYPTDQENQVTDPAMRDVRMRPDALDQLKRAKPLRQLLGDDFVEAHIMVKEIEHRAYQQVISSWERGHLLLNV